MSTYAELAAQKAELLKQAAEIDAQAEAARIAEKAEVIAHIKAQMAAHDVRLSDLGTPRSKSARAAKTPRASNSVNPLAGRKIAAKYADPVLGLTWSGRGLLPKWLREEIAAGRKLEAFKVKA
jgi:DNA-binding protein H-NS